MAAQGPQLQANMLPPGNASTASDKLQKPRHRASVACALCRERRTRCVVLMGQTECMQCKSNGQQCMINYDDERRKPNSKAYMSALTNRITHLENLLRERDEREHQLGDSPPSAPNTRTNQAGTSFEAEQQAKDDVATQPRQPLSAQGPDLLHPESDADGGSPQSSSTLGSASMVSKLLSSTGHLSFDQLSGRLRYFGPVANCHVHSELKSQSEDATRQALEQQRRAEKAIRSISLDTHDYLMNLFWDHYNSVLHVVHQAAFEEGRERSGGQFYSGFLHICILAMGYRFCQKDRPDMARISLPNKENTLHREAKYMLEYEIEQPGGIPSIVALLLLGDLETGVGRDNLGWLYAGMANRLCFEIGLHLDTTNTGASLREIEIGRMTLWACIIYDKYWALFLGRPTMMKPADLEVYQLSVEFERLGTSLPAGPARSRETQIYEALLDLMELAGRITEIMDQASKLSTNIDHHVYFRMSALHRDLESWYSRLPKSLQWTAENIANSPFSFFLLHQQYSAAMILLHRPFARYDDLNPAQSGSGSGESSDDDSFTGKVANPTNHFSALSRTICTQHAVRIARIFWQHRQRFDTKQICVTGLQHAGTAATALVAALAFMKDRSTRNNNMQYLECIAAALQDMSHTYVPAEKMSNVLAAVIIELRDAVPERRTVPARRRSSHHDARDPGSFKRHQSFHQDPSSRVPGSEVPQSRLQEPFTHVNASPIHFNDLNNIQSHISSEQHQDPNIERQAFTSDGWTILGYNGKQTSNIKDLPTLSQELSVFDHPVPPHDRSSSSSSHAHPNQLSQSHQDSFSLSAPAAPSNPNFTQYRSTNAWMGAETPRTGFSPSPIGFQTPHFRNHQTQRQQQQPSLRAALHEIQGLAPIDVAVLLNRDDRLDFGSLGTPSGLGTGFGGDLAVSHAGTGYHRGDAIMRDPDGCPPLPTAKSGPARGRPAGGVESSENRTTAGSGAAVDQRTKARSLGENERIFSKTVAGLADILRRGGEGS